MTVDIPTIKLSLIDTSSLLQIAFLFRCEIRKAAMLMQPVVIRNFQMPSNL
jgi:hypothetical protein